MISDNDNKSMKKWKKYQKKTSPSEWGGFDVLKKTYYFTITRCDVIPALVSTITM